MFYLLNKKSGISSFKYINDFARKNNIKKIGHTGTLDPLASGALLVATDEDTKLIDYISHTRKTYVATMCLGKVSNTYDSEGTITNQSSAKISLATVQKALANIKKTTTQIPPKFSAKKIKGQRAYDLARSNKDFELKPINIKITKIINVVEVGVNQFQFEIKVSKGTYIRSIIHDLGQKIGCGAIMTQLVRTKIGDLELQQSAYQVQEQDLISLPVIALTNIDLFLHGKTMETTFADGEYALVFQNKIVGIVVATNKVLKTKKLFGNKIKQLIEPF